MASGNKKGPVSIWPQVVCAATMSLVSFIIGMTIGFYGMSMLSLRTDKDIAATNADLGAIVSTGSMGNLLGTALALAFQQQIGYRRIVLLGAFLAASGFLTAACAVSISVVKLGIFLAGITAGIAGAAGQIYVLEIADGEHKAVLSSLGGINVNLGMFTAFVVGAVLPWRGALTVLAIVPVFLFLRVLQFPEVPSLLVSRGKVREAEEALVYFRGDVDSARNDVKSMVEVHKKRAATGDANKQGFLVDVKYILSTPEVRKNLLLLWFIIFTTCFSGYGGLVIFGKDLYKPLAGETIGNDAMTIIIGAFRVTLGLCAGVVLKALKRRTLLVTSGIGMGSCMALYAWANMGGQTPSPQLTAIAFLGFETLCHPGFFIVPFILMGELFPQRVRSTVTSLSRCVNGTFMGLGANFFIALKQRLPPTAFYGTNALLAFTGTLVVYLFLPETSGVSMADIEAKANKKKKQ